MAREREENYSRLSPALEGLYIHRDRAALTVHIWRRSGQLKALGSHLPPSFLFV